VVSISRNIKHKDEYQFWDGCLLQKFAAVTRKDRQQEYIEVELFIKQGLVQKLQISRLRYFENVFRVYLARLSYNLEW